MKRIILSAVVLIAVCVVFILGSRGVSRDEISRLQLMIQKERQRLLEGKRADCKKRREECCANIELLKKQLADVEKLRENLAEKKTLKRKIRIEKVRQTIPDTQQELRILERELNIAQAEIDRAKSEQKQLDIYYNEKIVYTKYDHQKKKYRQYKKRKHDMTWQEYQDRNNIINNRISNARHRVAQKKQEIAQCLERSKQNHLYRDEQEKNASIRIKNSDIDVQNEIIRKHNHEIEMRRRALDDSDKKLRTELQGKKEMASMLEKALAEADAQMELEQEYGDKTSFVHAHIICAALKSDSRARDMLSVFNNNDISTWRQFDICLSQLRPDIYEYMHRREYKIRRQQLCEGMNVKIDNDMLIFVSPQDILVAYSVVTKKYR